jgi:hypothetical protein
MHKGPGTMHISLSTTLLFSFLSAAGLFGCGGSLTCGELASCHSGCEREHPNSWDSKRQACDDACYDSASDEARSKYVELKLCPDFCNANACAPGHCRSMAMARYSDGEG